MDGSQYGAMGGLPYPFHTPMGLQQLWVAMVSLASTSANRFTSGALGLKFGLCKKKHNLRGAFGQIWHGRGPVQCHGSVAISFPYPNGTPTALGCNGHPCFHLSQPLHCWSSGPHIWPEPKQTQSQRCFRPNITWMAAITVPWDCCHILSIPQWVANSSGLQWSALLPTQLTLRSAGAQGLKFGHSQNEHDLRGALGEL